MKNKFRLIIFFSCLAVFFVFTSSVSAADRFWVGDTGSWNTAAEWSDSSGGAGGASVPGVGDDAYFDDNSFSADTSVVTVDVAAVPDNIYATGLDQRFTMVLANDITTGTFQVDGYNATASRAYISSSVKGTQRTITAAATDISNADFQDITGQTLGTIDEQVGVDIDDAMEKGDGVYSTSSTEVYMYSNTDDTNYLYICGGFRFQTVNVPQGATIVSATTSVSVSNASWDDPNQIIYGNDVDDANDFEEEQDIIDTRVRTDAGVEWDETGVGTGYQDAPPITAVIQEIVDRPGWVANNNIVLLWISNTDKNASLIVSDYSPSPSQLHIEYTVGWDLSGATGGSGDCGGNSGITFTTAADQYWHENSGNWDDSGNWFLATAGGGGAGRVPLCQDDVVFDADSFSGSATVAVNGMPRIGKNIDFSAIDQSVSFSGSTFSLYGSLTLSENISSVPGGQTMLFQGRGAHTLTSAGVQIDKAISIDMPGGSLTLQDAMLISAGGNGRLQINYGTFDANDQNVTADGLTSSNSNVRSLIMGSGDWVLSGFLSNVWNLGTNTNLTFDKGTGTIKFTSSDNTWSVPFNGGNLTYNNVWIATTGSQPMNIGNSNTFNDFKINAGRTVQFTAGTTNTFTTFTSMATVDATTTISSITASAHELVKAGGGTIESDYLYISYSEASPATTWYAGANSVDEGSNTGWIFTDVSDSYKVLVGKGIDTYQVMIDPRDLGIYGYISTTSIDGAQVTKDWNHVVMTYDGSVQKLYVNGVLKSSQALTGSIGTNASALEIGNGFAGKIDDVKIYNYARAPDEIRLDYNAGFGARFGPNSSCDRDPGSCMTEGLVGYWNFEEGTGTSTADISGNGNTGIFLEATGTPFWTSGIIPGSGGKKGGSALSFDGTDDYISALNVGNVRAVEFWVNDANAADGILELINDTTYVSISSSAIVATGFTSTSIYVNGVATSTLATGWNHVVVTDTADVAAASFLIGEANTDYMQGIIDEVRIYNRALSEAEIRYHYNRGGPVAHWKLDEGSGTTAYDTTEQDNDGTISGASWTTGKYGGALSFDGSNDYVSRAYDTDFNFASSSFTLSTWFKNENSDIGPKIIDVQVVASTDDVWVSAAGAMYFDPGQPSCTAGYFNSSYNSLGCPMRFLNLDIPTSATISAAYLIFVANAGNDSTTVNSVIVGEATTTAQTFSTLADYQARRGTVIGGADDTNITSASTTWDNIPAWTEGNSYDSPELKTIMQEIVDLPGWQGDGTDDVALFWDDHANRTTNIAERVRKAASWNDTIYDPPTFHVEYTTEASDYLISRYNEAGWKSWMDGVGNVCAGLDDDATWSPDDEICSSGTNYADGNFHHLEIVKNGTAGAYLYVDGHLAGSKTHLVATGSLSGTSPVLYAGIDSDGSSAPWQGAIDDVRIYNYARTHEQVREDYNAGLAASFGPKSSCNRDPGSCMTEGLVGYWNFEEGLGTTTADISGNGNTGISLEATGTPFWTSGIIPGSGGKKGGGALQFDGVDDYVKSASIVYVPDGFTVLVWWKRNGSSGGSSHSIIEAINGCVGACNRILVNSDGDTLTANVNVGSVKGATLSISNPNDWHQIGFKWDGANLYAIVDGVLSAPTAAAGTLASTGSGKILIGAYYQLNTYFANGLIDEVHIYSRALSETEIRYHYNRGAPVAHWKMDEGSGTTTYDGTPNGNDGIFLTAASSPVWVQGKYGSALNFDGVDDYVEVTDNSTLDITDAITLEAWTKTATVTDLPGDITIDSSALDFTWCTEHQGGPYWTSPTTGYVIYQDGGRELVYKKTTDGGETWGETVFINNNANQSIDTWADWQTPGDDGTKIHIASLDSTDDVINYIYLDTADDSTSTDAILAAEGSGEIYSGYDFRYLLISITKTIGGNIAVAYKHRDADLSGFLYGFYTSPNGDDWTSATTTVFEDNAYSVWQIYPGNEVDTNDVWMIYADTTDDEYSLKTYDDSEDSWSEQVLPGTDGWNWNYYAVQVDGQIRLSDNHLILAGWGEYDTATADLKVWDINGAGSITAKTDVITNKAENILSAVFINQVNDDIYVAYAAGAAAGANLSVYYKKSTDGGTTWSNETAMQVDAADDERWISAGAMKAAWGGKFQPIWHNDDLNDLFTNTDNGISIAVTGGPALLGKGQDAYQLQIDSRLYVSGYINDTEAVTARITREWHHIALTYDKLNVILYIDGNEKSSFATTSAINTNATNLKIGELVPGKIDDVRIYNYARTHEQVRQDYNAGLSTYFR